MFSEQSRFDNFVKVRKELFVPETQSLFVVRADVLNEVDYEGAFAASI